MKGLILKLGVFISVIWAPLYSATISGQIRYENRIYDSGGFTEATEFLPVRFAKVEVVVLGIETLTTYTDGSGNYSVEANNNGLQDVYIRAFTSNNLNYNIEVKDNPTNEQIYTVSSTPQNLDTNTSQTINLDITIAGTSGAFNIFDVALWAYQFIESLDAPLPSPLPRATLYWYPGSTNGTYFSVSQNAIFLLGKSSDPDEFDDDIILHEMGHWAAYNWSKDDSPGGTHSITEQYDARLTWSEGWGHYFSCAVRQYAGTTLYPEPTVIVDNFLGANSAFDIEVPSFSAQTIMATNEVAVAAVLWDIADSDNEGADTLSLGYLTTWLVFDEDIPGMEQITLEDFFKGLETRVGGAVISATQTIFNSRAIKYFLDPREPNNSLSEATPLAGTLSQNTFFHVNDQDWFKFTVSALDTITVQTTNLGDGCDTVLELFATDGHTLLALNDDRYATDLSSIITYTFASDGTYFVRATSYSGPGRVTEFGYYDITLSMVINTAPVIYTLQASTQEGTAPLRTDFTIDAQDPDGNITLYEWDFEGDGRYDFSSLEGGEASFTYSSAGTFNATARVTDNTGSSTIKSIKITVTSAGMAEISIDTLLTGTVAPATVKFTPKIDGITPVSYEWDFDGDYLIDYSSITSPGAEFTYRMPGSYIPRFIVTDQQGISHIAYATQITISPGTNPPTITSLNVSPSTGNIPLACTLEVSSSDDGSIIGYKWDFEGDGTIDRITATPSTTFTYTRVGLFLPAVTVIDDHGLVAKGSTSILVSQPNFPVGVILEPEGDRRIAGDSITLVAEVQPPGAHRNLLFQYRLESETSWTDIGEPITSSGTIFTGSWDLSDFADGTLLYLRTLIDGSYSTEQGIRTLLIDRSSPEIHEYLDLEGLRVKEEIIDPYTDSTIYTQDGVRLMFPAGCIAEACVVKIANLTQAHLPVGIPDGLVFIGKGIQIDAVTQFENNFYIEILADDFSYQGATQSNIDMGSLQIWWWDSGQGRWRRDFMSQVNRTERLVKVRAQHLTDWGVFGSFISYTELEDEEVCAVRIAYQDAQKGPHTLLVLSGLFLFLIGISIVILYIISGRKWAGI